MNAIGAIRKPGVMAHFRAGFDRGRGVRADDKPAEVPVAIIGFAGVERDVVAVVVDAEGKVSRAGLHELVVTDEGALGAARATRGVSNRG
jgi:hypothetical protein